MGFTPIVLFIICSKIFKRGCEKDHKKKSIVSLGCGGENRAPGPLFGTSQGRILIQKNLSRSSAMDYALYIARHAQSRALSLSWWH